MQKTVRKMLLYFLNNVKKIIVAALDRRGAY